MIGFQTSLKTRLQLFVLLDLFDSRMGELRFFGVQTNKNELLKKKINVQTNFYG